MKLTSPYGYRNLNGEQNWHSGYDLVGIGSKEVIAVAGGTVIRSRIITDKNNLTWEWGNYVCVKTNDTDRAEQILKKVCGLNPEFAPAHKDLGVIYLNKRLFDYAKDEFERAYAIAPDNYSIVVEYANYLHSVSDFENADKC